MEEEDSMDGVEDGRARNPLAFLGLQRVGSDLDDSPVKKSLIELNSRGLPARKRKKNSLIYGADDLVSIPLKSPKKKLIASPMKVIHVKEPEKSKSETNGKSRVGDKFDNNFFEDDELEEELEDMDKSVDFYAEEIEILKPVKATPTKRKDIAEVKPKTELDEMDEKISVANRLNAQRLGVALRNLLKLPKAHKWVCFEFFYSNIDKVLFHGENDFMVCLRESLPQLKTRRLSRVEWCKVRRLMGKPRRCSEAFFSEERAELARKRKKIRMLQQRKMGDSNSFKDLPEEIPMQLTIGSRVTARLRQPADGLFTGVVDAVDTSNSTYRVTFSRQGLGTHSVPDTEVLSTEAPDLMPLAGFLSKARPRPLPSLETYLDPPASYPETSSFSPQLTGDPLLSGSTPRGKSLRLDGTLGGYPVKFLFHIVKLNKSLAAKKDRVHSLRELNSEAEKTKSFGEFITEDFQRRYAGNVMDVYKVNEELNRHLEDVARFTAQFGDSPGPSLSLPDQIKENCQEEGYDMVNKYNVSTIGPAEGLADCVQSPRLLALITSLSALMLQVKRVADGERNAAELQALKESVSDMRGTLQGESLSVFQDCVEVHMQHIQQGLSMMGNLTKFMEQPTATLQN